MVDAASLALFFFFPSAPCVLSGSNEPRQNFHLNRLMQTKQQKMSLPALSSSNSSNPTLNDAEQPSDSAVFADDRIVALQCDDASLELKHAAIAYIRNKLSVMRPCFIHRVVASIAVVSAVVNLLASSSDPDLRVRCFQHRDKLA